MAQAQTTKFGKFKIYVEATAGSGTFIAPCGLTQKSFDLSASANEDTIPDCDDPDAPAWVARTVASLSAGVSGQGVWDGDAYATWRALFLAAESFNVRIEFDETGANGGGYYEGAMVLTALGNSASIGQRVQASVTLASDGPLTWVAAA
jgi:hypothetical protein